MALTNHGLVAYCKECLAQGDRNVYVYGSIGQKLSLALINDRAKAYPKMNTSARVRLFKNILNTGKTTYAYDCVGLIKSYLWGGYGRVKYNSKQDVSANGMYEVAKKRGNIRTLPEVPGVLVQMNGHIGVYIGNGYVIECTPNKAFAKQSHGAGGVCKTKLSARKWEHWCYCPWITYTSKIDTSKEYDNAIEFVPYKAEVTANLLNCRSGAGTQHSIKKVLKQGEKVIITNESNGWGRMVDGWISLKYIKKLSSYKVKITADVLNCRNGAGTKYNVTSRYLKNDEVHILDEKDGWGQTSRGWISLKYTKKI